VVFVSSRRPLLHTHAAPLPSMDVGGANDFEMSEKNKRIRKFLANTCQEQRTLNCFSWGSLRIQICPDSPLKGVEFNEGVYVSIYDPLTDTMMQFSIPVDAVELEENALSENATNNNT
jgi:hypothetical protein